MHNSLRIRTIGAMSSDAANTPIASTRLVVGMEVHVELATRSKMFSRSPNIAHPDYYDSPPNTLVDPVVLALPGALPVMNSAAIEMSILVGLALNCTIASFSRWNRKNYFYPDLPKGYQISQYDLPLCGDGQLTITGVDGHEKTIGIIRAHLEEDAGKLGHELPGGEHYDGSLIDLNRAGTPLLEIVSQPDLTSADDAVIYCRELHNLCRFLGVTGGVMQRGHTRFEPNVNVIITTDDGREHATPIVEMKNLNSFRAVKAAIEHEHTRQIEQWKQSGEVMGPGTKSTRGWDDAKQVTFLQRSKEDAHDYRYFPDPDLAPVEVSPQWLEQIRARLPKLPRERRLHYIHAYGLAPVDAETLTAQRPLCEFYEQCVDAAIAAMGESDTTTHSGRECAKLLLNVGARFANERETSIERLGITPAQVGQLLRLRHDNHIGSSAADELFALLCETDEDAATAAERAHLLQVHDADLVDEWVAEAIAAEPDSAADYAAGKDAAIGRLMGAVMKCSGGKADARSVQQHLRAQLRGE